MLTALYLLLHDATIILNFFFRPHLVVMCEEGQFQCPDTGLCFSNEVLCDNFTDCPGGFDEQNCTGKNVTNQISYILLWQLCYDTCTYGLLET